MTQQLRTFQSNFTGGELSPSMWSRTDISKYQSGVRNLQNMLIRPEGGVRARGGTQFIGHGGGVGASCWLMPFDIGPGESYVLEFTENVMRFIRNGAYVLLASSGVTITSYVGTDDVVFTRNAHGFVAGDRIYLDLFVTDDPDFNGVFATVSVATANTFTLYRAVGGPLVRDGGPITGVGRATKVYSITTPYTYEQFRAVRMAQDHTVGYLLNRTHPVQRLVRIAPDNWTLTAEAFAPGILPPTGVVASVLSGTGTTAYTYVVSVVSADTGEESLQSLSSTIQNDLSIVNSVNRVVWNAVTGAARYIVYKVENGVFGYIGGTTALLFDDENITADLSDTPQQARNPFSGEGNYPGVGTFFEQRLVLASTDLNPGGVWASQSANPRNFGVSSPLKANDAITFRIRANRATRIEAIVPTERLLLMTSGGEWVVTGGDDAGYLTPTNIVLRRRAFRGSTSVQPVLVGDFVVHVQRGGDAVRDFNLGRDVASTDLSLLAKHLLKGRMVVAMAYQQKPDSVIWVVMNDGNVATLTYMLEHDIWGWAPMDFGGEVQDVAVVAEGIDGGEDAVYLAIKRFVGLVPYAGVERLSTLEGAQAFLPSLTGSPIPRPVTDAYHVDAGQYLRGATPVTTVRNLWHLEGQNVVALLDGNVSELMQVVNGAVELAYPASIIAIGLPYIARLRTLDLDIGAVQGLGSMLGRYKSLTEVGLRVTDTRAIFVGHDNELDAVEHRQRALELWGDAIELFTGDITITPMPDWTTGGGIVVEQRDPLPVSITGILATWEFGE